jgi:uncharacterized protein
MSRVETLVSDTDLGDDRMTFRQLNWLWAISGAIWGEGGAGIVVKRMRLIVGAIRLSELIMPMLTSAPGSQLGRLMQERPETLGALLWPYQCTGWSARERIAKIIAHYNAIEKIGGPIDFPVGDRLLLLDLAAIRDGLQVIIDRPKWFMREGQLVINLFQRETRIYSLAFSLWMEADGLTAFIGAIQGRDIEGALEEYREVTRATHGMRPRDFLVELFRMFCSLLAVHRILAVSDEFRHHRSNYFGSSAEAKFSTNYDDIWQDRGGVRVDPMFYHIDVESRRRDLESIPAKKRGVYRRRYEMLDSLQRLMADGYHQQNVTVAGNRQSLVPSN